MSLHIINSENLHHAYCIVGDNQSALSDLHKFLKNKLDFNIEGNPDFYYGEYDVLDIEDGRKLKELHQNKPTAGERKIFVVNTNFITLQAQNSMLKIFEEPVGGTHFFMIMPSAHGLIPTLKSRLLIVQHGSANSTKIEAKDFLKANVGDRMDMVKKLAEDISNEEESKIEVVKFMNSLEKEIFSRKGLSSPATFESLGKMRQYASEQSPSLRMILEYLALSIPNV